MNEQTNIGLHTHGTTDRRAPLGSIALILALVAALSLSGCIGLTGAGTPKNSSSSSTSSGTLVASPTSLSFSNVPAGLKFPLTLTLTNTGSAAVMISSASIRGAGFSLVGGMTSVSIAAGEKHTFQVEFAPTGVGADSGSLSITSDATDSPLTVALSGTGTNAFKILVPPGSQSVKVGQTVDFAVATTASGGVTYQWSKNGTPINGATAASYRTPATTLADNGAQFTVVASDSGVSLTSSPAILTVTAASVGPSIVTGPVSRTVAAGQTATFSVTATGTAPLMYQWKKNGADISGATLSSYSTPATASADNGAQFSVTVSNSVSSATSNAATLTVSAPPSNPPSITAQPASKSVVAGQAATFSVIATGTGTLTYQWNRSGVAISGANSASYTTPATTAADSGAQFTVTVSNSVGKITSSPATLTVTAAGTLILNPSQNSLSFSSVNIGSNSVLPVGFTNGGTSNVTISNVTVSGAGYTASGVSSGQILTPGQTATLNVTFTPSAAGLLSGSVKVASDAGNSPASVTLSGTGVQPVVAHSVTLTWTASTSAVSGYNVHRSTVTGGPYTKVNSALVAATTYVDTTVQSGQTYFYVITAVDSSNVESAFSNEASVIVP